MACRFCGDSGIWISPVYGAAHPCLECKNTEVKNSTTSVQYDEGSGVAERCTGNRYWRVEGEYHRLDGPAIMYANGTSIWYINGDLHREDGPACEYTNGTKCWYINGKRHREDGPAIEYASGSEYQYLNDVCLSKEEFKEKLKDLS